MDLRGWVFWVYRLGLVGVGDIYISGFVPLLYFFKGTNGEGAFSILPLFEVWSSAYLSTQATLPKQLHQLLTNTQNHLSRPLSLARFKSDQYTLSGSGAARFLEEEAISGGFYVRKVGEIHHDVEDGSSTFGGRGRKRGGLGRVRVGFLDGGDGRFGGRGGLRGCVGVSVEAVERCAVERQMPAKSDTRK